MNDLGIDIDRIVELDTQVATNNALGFDEGSSSTWEQIIAVIASIREPEPS